MKHIALILICCLARHARADVPVVEGHAAIGLRVSRTTASRYENVYGDSSAVQVAADGMLGHRVGQVLVGIRAGVVTPYRFSASPIHDSPEQVPYTSSTIYPLDLGVGVQLDTRDVSVSAWLGATMAFAHADSAATHVNAIDFTGDIPAASWKYETTNFSYGIGVGRDIAKHLAIFASFESQGIGPIPIRYNRGGTSRVPDSTTANSLTLGGAARF